MNIIQKEATEIHFGLSPHNFRMVKISSSLVPPEESKWILMNVEPSVVPFISKEGNSWICSPPKFYREAEKKAMSFDDSLKLAKEYCEFLDTCEVF